MLRFLPAAPFRGRAAPRSAAGRRQRPAAVLDMRGLADNAFDQQYFLHRPFDRRQFQRAEGLRTLPVAAIVDRDVRFGAPETSDSAVHDRRLFLASR
jgi:hypothetical protein